MDTQRIHELIARDRYTHFIARSLAWLLAGCASLCGIKMFDHDNYVRYFAPYENLVNEVSTVIIISSVVCLVLWHLHRPSIAYAVSVIFFGVMAYFPNSQIVGQIVLCLLMALYAYIIIAPQKASTPTKAEAKQSVNPSVPTCTVCHKESQYEVCLACEQKYKLERHRIRAQMARAKDNGAPATLTLGQWIETIEAFQYHCAYCQTGPYEVMEHYLPVVLGGGTTQENCLPACRSCNSKKSDKHPDLGIRIPKPNPLSALHRPRNTVQPSKA